jgi:superfamily I DNA/RNA helicase
VFIDEAQDFGVNALRFGVGLADERFNDVLIVADAAQNVFGRRSSWREAGVQAQGRTRILRRNYRNTRQIVEFAYCVVQPNPDVEFDPDDETMIIPPESAMREGVPPTVTFDEQDSIIDRVVRLAKEHVARNKAASSLAILTMGNEEAIVIERRLLAANIPFFFASDPQNRSNRDSAGSALEPIVLSTIYTAKGLEFPNVVVSCAARLGQDVNELRMSLYVGMTRATERLTVLIDPEHLLAADVRRAVDEVAD